MRRWSRSLAAALNPGALAGVLGDARSERAAFNLELEARPWTRSAEDMEVLILLTLLIALDLAAWRWGHDSRQVPWRREVAAGQALVTARKRLGVPPLLTCWRGGR